MQSTASATADEPKLTALSSFWRRRDPLLWVVGAIVCCAIILTLIQISILLASSVKHGLLLDPGGWTVANFRTVLTHHLFFPTLANTIALGIGSVVVMLCFAVPFAWLYTRTDLPAKSTLLVLMTVNIAIPGFLIALGYIFLFNPSNGLGNEFVRLVFGSNISLFNVYSIGWMIVLQGLALASPAFFMIVPTFKAIDVSLEEAAAVSGVRRAVAALKIVFPLAAPAILATATYYFVIAIEIFDYPSMLGLPVRKFVISTWIYQFIYPADNNVPSYGEAAALGVLTTVAAIALGTVYLWFTRQASRYVVVTGKRRIQGNMPLTKSAKAVAWIVIAVYSTFALLIPLLMLIWASLIPYLQMPSLQAFGRITFSAYREAFVELPKLVVNNLTVMLTVPTISVAFAACIAWISTRTRLRARRSLDVLVMASIAVPSIVGALAFLYLGLFIYRVIPIYTTIWIIVLAMATRYTTWGNRTISSAMLQVHSEMEEACAVSGVKRGRAFLSVLLPIVAPALLFSWFWIALLSMRELTIPIMLARPNTDVLATTIWGLNAAGSTNVASALSVILVGAILVMVFVFQRVAGRFSV
jgi:iron(III) transport system permease protein